MGSKLFRLIGLMFVLTFWGCGGDKPPSTQQISANRGTTPLQTGAIKLNEVARAAAQDVETVPQSSLEGTAVPVIALEEMHGSRVGQLQHAISLCRLHERYGLNDIVLEGYLKGRPDLNTDWFTKAVGENSPVARARVAVEFLKQGDVSAVEFTKLVYPDVRVYQAEVAEFYDVEPPTSDPFKEYLQNIARFNSSWAEEKSRPYRSLETFLKMSGEEKLNSAKEIKQYAEQHSIFVSPDAQQAMDQFINFFEKRLGSNKTINDTLTSVSNSGQAKLVVANIGADHTTNICRMFLDSHRPYAVLKPLYIPGKPEQSNLTSAMYERKSRMLPVFSRGLSALIVQEVSGAKKPEPIISEVWFQAEAEIFGFVDRLARGILGPPGGPPNGGKPPFGFSDGDFNGTQISIVLDNVQYLGNDSKHRSILLPVTFKKSGHTVWVAATLRREVEAGQATVESILSQALQGVQEESKTPEQAEDKVGQVQMSTVTFGIVGKDKNAVKQAILSLT